MDRAAPRPPEPRLWPRLCGLAALGGGVLVLVGWLAGIDALKGLVPGWATMKPITALCFVAAGGALLLELRGAPRDLRLARSGGALVAGIAAWTLAEYLSGLDLGSGALVLPSLGRAENLPHPGRMAAITALDLLMIGLALAWPAARASRWREAPLLLALLGGLVPLAGYVYGAHELFMPVGATSIAAHTAALIVLLSMGILGARPAGPVAAVVLSERLGGWMLRRQLPLLVGTLALVGWVRLAGEKAGWFGTEFGVALVVLVTTVVTALLVWFLARRLNDADRSREASERAERDTAVRYRALFEQSPVGIVLVDPATAGFVEFNAAAHRALGYSREEFARLHLRDIEAVESEELIRAHIARILDSAGDDFATLHRGRDGTVRDVRVRARRVEEQGRALICAVFEDIGPRAPT